MKAVPSARSSARRCSSTASSWRPRFWRALPTAQWPRNWCGSSSSVRRAWASSASWSPAKAWCRPTRAETTSDSGSSSSARRSDAGRFVAAAAQVQDEAEPRVGPRGIGRQLDGPAQLALGPVPVPVLQEAKEGRRDVRLRDPVVEGQGLPRRLRRRAPRPRAAGERRRSPPPGTRPRGPRAAARSADRGPWPRRSSTSPSRPRAARSGPRRIDRGSRPGRPRGSPSGGGRAAGALLCSAPPRGPPPRARPPCPRRRRGA